MGLITSLDVSLSTKVSEDVRNFAVTTPELRIVTTAYTTRIVNMVAGCVPTAADIPVDTTSLTDKSITNLQRVAEVADAAQSAAAASETKSDEALAAATTAQSSADAAMAQAEAATDMAATNTLSISSILSNFTAWVLGTYLGALTLLDVAIAAGDSIQAMAGKLQGQLNAVKVRLGLLEDDLIYEVLTTAPTASVSISLDKNGQPFNLYECVLYIINPTWPSTTVLFRVNNNAAAIYNSAGFGGANRFQIDIGELGGMCRAIFYFDKDIDSVTFNAQSGRKYSTGYFSAHSAGFTNIGQITTEITRIDILPSAGVIPAGTKILLKKK